MINITVISELNKSITVQSLSLSSSTSAFVNQSIQEPYDNYLVSVATNTNAATLSNFFSGFSSANSSMIGFVVILACIIAFSFAIIKWSKT
jgi:hypothetical protein